MTHSADMCSLRELYALGGLDQSELVEFEKHLQSCADCQTAMPALMQVHDMLLFDFEDVEVPAGMRDRVLENIFADAPNGSAIDSPDRITDNRSGHKSMATERQTVLPSTPSRRSRRRPSRNWLPWVTAGAAAVIVAGASLLFQPAAVKSPLGNVIANMPLQTASATVTGKAQMWLTSAGTSKQMLIQFEGLQPLQGTQIYQVWLMNKGGKPYSCGVFTPDANGKAVFASIVPTTSYTVVAVTLEPKAIDPAPLGAAQFEAIAPQNTAL